VGEGAGGGTAWLEGERHDDENEEVVEVRDGGKGKQAWQIDLVCAKY